MLGGAARTAAAQDTYLLVVTGVGGDEEHAAEFHTWAASLLDAARRHDGIPDANITFLAEKPDRDPARIKGRSTKENITNALTSIATRAKPADEVFIALFGHGSFDGKESAFNLPGPDLTATEYAKLLERIPSTHVVFVNTSSASGEFVKALAGPGRTIITATKTGGERNDTRFPAFFAEAFAGEGADANRDGRVSVREAFEYARTKVTQEYEKKGLILTEHATLEDGSGGTQAAMLFLDPGRSVAASAAAMADPAMRALLEQKAALEAQITGLRLRKASMEPAQYDQELEKLLTALALNSRAIQQAGAK